MNLAMRVRVARIKYLEGAYTPEGSMGNNDLTSSGDLNSGKEQVSAARLWRCARLVSELSKEAFSSQCEQLQGIYTVAIFLERTKRQLQRELEQAGCEADMKRPLHLHELRGIQALQSIVFDYHTTSWNSIWDRLARSQVLIMDRITIVRYIWAPVVALLTRSYPGFSYHYRAWLHHAYVSLRGSAPLTRKYENWSDWPGRLRYADPHERMLRFIGGVVFARAEAADCDPDSAEIKPCRFEQWLRDAKRVRPYIDDKDLDGFVYLFINDEV